MKVLSLFDWIACWYEALIRAWIPVDEYYASEIDKYAIQIAIKNHPDIIEIWDVTQVKWEDYKWRDLLIGGSPCQWFSIAGKQLNFEDPRSKLFFEFVRILKEAQPKYFLLENVKMKKEFKNKISELIWCEPIEINSALVSAQNRKRLYWTNIPWIQQPEDKWILLRDILENNVDKKYYFSKERWDRIVKDPKVIFLPCGTQYNSSNSFWNSYGSQKAYTLRASTPNWVIEDVWIVRKLTPTECERLQTLSDGYTSGVSDSQRYKMLGNWWTVDIIAHIFSYINKE